MTRAHLHLSMLLAASLSAAGCKDLPELEYETEHLELGAEFPLCQGNLDHYEHVVTTLESALDTTLDQKVKVYIWDSREHDDPGWCNTGTEGCYDNGKVFSSLMLVEHELVHAVVDTLGSSPSAFWSEGAAEALQVQRTRDGITKPGMIVDKVLPSDISYATAGHFSRWLLETYGIELYRELLRSPKDGREAFESVYGMSFSDAEAAYFEQAPHSYGAYISCDDLPLAQVDNQNWSESIEIDCNEPGTYADIEGFYSRRVVTITERANYAISTSAAGMVISRCHDSAYDEPPSLDDTEQYGEVPEYTDIWRTGYARVLLGSGAVTTLDLTPGRYLLGFGNLAFESQTVTLDVSVAE